MYIVINASTSATMNPMATGFKATGDRNRYTFADKDEAKAFAEFCARKWPEATFSLMEKIGSVSVVTAQPPVEWR